MPTTFKFINHACFTLTHAGHTVIFDPYLDGSTQDINDLGRRNNCCIGRFSKLYSTAKMVEMTMRNKNIFLLIIY